MSYDLMVFDPEEAPRDRKHFIDWYHRTTEWNEGHDYSDPNATTLALREWYADIRKLFPNMNGPGSPTDAELMIPSVEDRLADYTFAHHAIYATFAWSEAENVYPLVRELAVKHGVGLFDASCDEPEPEIYFPGDESRPPSGGKWREVAADFRSGDVSKYIPTNFPQEETPTRRWFDIFRRNK
jgi:hypothetical protein